MPNLAAIDIIKNHHVTTTGLETDPVTQETISLIERDEGDVLHAYPDPVTHGKPWTIGFGHTGPEVVPGLRIDQAQADALLHADLAKFEDGVDDLLADNAVTSDNEFGALVSLAFNCGTGALVGSQLVEYHNAGRKDMAAGCFLHYCHAAGRVIPALARRRAEERALYLTPDKG